MNVASRCRRRVLIKVISFRVFSKISLGSSEGQRRQFGAQTIAKLFTSIFVTAHILGREKIYKRQPQKAVNVKSMRLSNYKTTFSFTNAFKGVDYNQ